MKHIIKIAILCFVALFAVASVGEVRAQDVLDSLAEESDNFEDSDTIAGADGSKDGEANPENMDSLLNVLYTDMYSDNVVSVCEPRHSNPTFSEKVYRERLSRMRTIVKMPYNSYVRSYIDLYAGRLRTSTSAMLGASSFYMPTFEIALESMQIPLEMRYLPIIESGLNPRATSGAGAAGLWQFMPSTGRMLGLEINSLVDERRDLEKSSYAAAEYLKKLYDTFHDWTLVIAAYNCGPGTVSKAIKRAGGRRDYWTIYPYLPRATRNYVPAFIATNYIMTYYCEHGICPVQAHLPDNTDTIMLSRRLHFSQIAKITGRSVDYIKKLNPQYRASVIPGSKANPCSLRMTLDDLGKLIQKGESLYDGEDEDAINDVLDVEDDGDSSDNSKAGGPTPTVEKINADIPKESSTPKPVKSISTDEGPTKKVPLSGE